MGCTIFGSYIIFHSFKLSYYGTLDGAEVLTVGSHGNFMACPTGATLASLDCTVPTEIVPSLPGSFMALV